MKEQYKKWANLDIKEVEPMEVTDIEIARMKRKVINSKTTKTKQRKWRNVIAASLFLLGVVITVNTTSIATNIKGYFEDVIRWDGTVVDTQYTAGIDDIEVITGSVSNSGSHFVVPVTVTLNNIEEEPYASMEALGLREFIIVDNSNNDMGKIEIQEEPGSHNSTGSELDEKEKVFTETNSDSDSTRVFKIKLLVDSELITKGEQYKLMINSLYLYKTADAPLEVSGDWHVNLTIE